VAPTLCGIVGVVSAEREVPSLLYRSLRKLEYRGYDSVGIATIGSAVKVIKRVGGVNEIENLMQGLGGKTGIGHTRWATHGEVNERNAHPHFDCTGKIAVVHNGIIENFSEIREFLSERGHTLISETDTEVIAHLIEDELSSGLNLLESVRRALLKLKGSYAIAVIYEEEPSKIVCARKESPLLIGIGNGENYCSSDYVALLPYTKEFIVLNDGEMAEITPHSCKVFRIDTGEEVKKEKTIMDWKPEQARRNGYEHFMLKEIMEQPMVISNSLRIPRKELKEAVDVIASSEYIYVVGAGSSYHASLGMEYLLTNLGGMRAKAIISSEFENYSPRGLEDSVVLCVTQSGETADTLKAAKISKRRGATVLAMTNLVGSSITRISDHTIYMRAGPEVGVAATKTFTTQLALMSLLSIEVSYNRGEITNSERTELEVELRSIPRKTSSLLKGLKDLRNLSRRLIDRKSFYFLGTSIGLVTALEGALKLKEIAYVHAEGYPMGESKHGPIALVEDGFPVIVVDHGDEKERIEYGVMEMASRGAEIVVVSPREIKGESLIKTPEVSPILSPVIQVVPLQLFAYYSAVERGLNPDRPRNLAKSVTVL